MFAEGWPRCLPLAIACKSPQLVALLTEGLKEVLRDDDIAEDAFAAVNTLPLV